MLSDFQMILSVGIQAIALIAVLVLLIASIALKISTKSPGGVFILIGGILQLLVSLGFLPFSLMGWFGEAEFLTNHFMMISAVLGIFGVFGTASMAIGFLVLAGHLKSLEQAA